MTAGMWFFVGALAVVGLADHYGWLDVLEGINQPDDGGKTDR